MLLTTYIIENYIGVVPMFFTKLEIAWGNVPMLFTRLGITWGNVSRLFTRFGITWKMFPCYSHLWE